MKIALILSFSLALFAFDSLTASKIFDKILHGLMQKEKISVYTSNEKYAGVIRDAQRLVLIKDAKKADIILVNDFDEIPEGSERQLLFSTSYPVFKQMDNAVGAFYWDRGHIKIEFSKRRLKKYNISLKPSLSKYIKEDD